MAERIDVTTPDGKVHQHVGSLQTGPVDFRTLPDGSIEIYTFSGSTVTVRGAGGQVIRRPNYKETVLETYPPGSQVRLI